VIALRNFCYSSVFQISKSNQSPKLKFQSKIQTSVF
jgi:hypothetical protein